MLLDGQLPGTLETFSQEPQQSVEAACGLSSQLPHGKRIAVFLPWSSGAATLIPVPPFAQMRSDASSGFKMKLAGEHGYRNTTQMTGSLSSSFATSAPKTRPRSRTGLQKLLRFHSGAPYRGICPPLSPSDRSALRPAKSPSPNKASISDSAGTSDTNSKASNLVGHFVRKTDVSLLCEPIIVIQQSDCIREQKLSRFSSKSRLRDETSQAAAIRITTPACDIKSVSRDCHCGMDPLFQP